MNNLPLEIELIEKNHLERLLIALNEQKNNEIIFRNTIMIELKKLLEKSKVKKIEKTYIYNFFKKIQQIIIFKNSYILVYRNKIASYKYIELKMKDVPEFITIDIDKYLSLLDKIIHKKQSQPISSAVNIDFMPFYDYSAKIQKSEDIGSGIQFLNRNLSGNFMKNSNQWNEILYNFLKIHSIGNIPLLINSEIINSYSLLIKSLDFFLEDAYLRPERYKGEKLNSSMRKVGFEPGWGNSLPRVLDTMKLLDACLNAPDENILEKFITRIPMISKIVIVSPHGWFGQKKVLGKPDTGGQVVYILDQIKYLEKKLKQDLKTAGINITPKLIIITRLIPNSEDTTCNLEEEKVEGTDNCWIVRVPFKNNKGEIVPQWISRFNIWPYLEQFSIDVKEKCIEIFQGRPDIIIGNYSDGNLVATFLAKYFGVMQCNIAHALEKTKYVNSDLNWFELEKNYNFSFQYTADIYAMNMASFIITSTFQEIGGTADTLGQYESYTTFSMPDLFHIKNGVNLFHPKFNVIPPGVPEDIFFSYSEKTKRDAILSKRLEQILFHEKNNNIFGSFEDQSKPIIFSMSRLDKIKNLSGLVELYAKNENLQKETNLLLITDKISSEQSKDHEETAEILKIYETIAKYSLDKKIRWISFTAQKKELGEIYRIIADKKGVFVQPALYEAFGLTVIESMASGLPTFATKFGGPLEIIQNDVNGFLINPTIQEQTSNLLLNFFEKTKPNNLLWTRISKRAVERVKKHYNWDLYAEKVLSLARFYGFWKFSVSDKAKEKLSLYSDLFFDNFYRKRLPKDY
jgi:sucrose synthase